MLLTCGLPAASNISAPKAQKLGKSSATEGVALRRTHHVAVTFSAGSARRFRLVDRSGRRPHIVPGGERLQVVFLEKVFAVKEELRVADVGQRVERARLVR